MGVICMLITPKRGYRVCLHCGKILLSKQVVDGKFNGKKVKVCPYCNEPEKISTGNDIIYLPGLKTYIISAISGISYKLIVDELFMPKCEYLGYCTESQGCGRKDRKG